MKPTLISYSLIIQMFSNAGIEPLSIYLWAYKNVPKQSNGFIKYIGAKKDKVN